MVYVTGDTHRDFSRYLAFSKRYGWSQDDVMVILGDAGLNYFGGKQDFLLKKEVNSYPITTFCIHGNHEMRPYEIRSYRQKQFCGGTVWYEERFPNLLFAKDGEIYNFNGLSCMAIGGAYSVDKYIRLARGWHWFESEQPNEDIKLYVESQLKKVNHSVDVILSHTCPYVYEPIEVFLPFLSQTGVDKSTEKWLGEIEASTEYKKWYCGHFHTSKKVDRIQFMYEDIDVLSAK